MRRTLVAPALAAALLLHLPAPATAQFGGLAKKAKAAVAKSAEEKAEAQIPFTPPAAPDFDDHVQEITAARLDQLLAGFAAEVAYAPKAKADYEAWRRDLDAKTAAYEKAMPGYQKARATWDACEAKFIEGEMKASADNEATIEKAMAGMSGPQFEKYAEDLAMRGQRLAPKIQAGASDPATVKEGEQFQREIAILQREQQRRMQAAMRGIEAQQARARTANPRLVAACGAEPVAPVRPSDAVQGPESLVLQQGADKANLTGERDTPEAKQGRYAIMRERVIYFVQSKRRPSGMGFSQAEYDLLVARGDAVSDAVKAMQQAGVSL